MTRVGVGVGSKAARAADRVDAGKFGLSGVEWQASEYFEGLFVWKSHDG